MEDKRLGSAVLILNKEDAYYQKTGKIIEILEAYFNLVVEFPGGKINLYKESEIHFLKAPLAPSYVWTLSENTPLETVYLN